MYYLASLFARNWPYLRSQIWFRALCAAIPLCIATPMLIHGLVYHESGEIVPGAIWFGIGVFLTGWAALLVHFTRQLKRRQQGQPELPPAERWRTLGIALGAVVALFVVVVSLSIGVARQQGSLRYLGDDEHGLYMVALTANGNTVSSAGCQFEDDGLHVSAGAVCYPTVDQLGSSSGIVAVKQRSGGAEAYVCLVFHRQSAGNFDQFCVNSQGQWMADKAVNAHQTFLVEPTANSVIRQGVNQVNTLKVRVTGAQFTCFVNGIAVGQASDATFPAGLWGLGTIGTEGVFADLIVATIG